jgi:hypothetical protein
MISSSKNNFGEDSYGYPSNSKSTQINQYSNNKIS